MKCPKCGLTNPETALWCDCGYDFESKKERPRTLSARDSLRTSDRVRFVVGFIILFMFLIQTAPLGDLRILIGIGEVIVAFAIAYIWKGRKADWRGMSIVFLTACVILSILVGMIPFFLKPIR